MLLVLLSACSLAFGQINEEYRFAQYEVPDTYTHDNADTICVLTMGCLAANGYGQWTTSSATNTQIPGPGENPTTWPQNGWFLLGNRLDKSDLPTNGQVTPPGVVAKGQFSGAFPPEAKVATNLNGSVRYVWVKLDPPNSGVHRKFFVVQGFNDERAPNSPQQQIDILFNSFPNPYINRQVVKQPIYHYQAGTDIPTGGNAVSIEGGTANTDWRDEFDIAMDKNFLYIVWSIQAGAGKEVWATVINLDLGTVVGAQYPKKIATDGHRPTVTCDVRNGGTPRFSVSCIGFTTVNAQLYDIIGATVTPLVLAANFTDPINGTSTIITNITHARVVRKLDQQSQFSFSHTALYVIADGKLLLHNPIGVNAMYVDGARLVPVAPLISKGGGFPGYSVLDRPIVAFANPYDEQTTPNGPKQFHVLYQLNEANATPHPTVSRSPLVIARNHDAATRICLNVPKLTETLVPTQSSYIGAELLQDDPAWYVGAVNQMGIHVHWRTSGTSPTHFYSRDINRSFDEAIEEYTLVTNNCWVEDGSSHGGTTGAVVLPEKRMTIWSDPNWGRVMSQTFTNVGATDFLRLNPIDNAKGKLVFKGDNVTLNIGIEGSENLPTHFVTLTNFKCVFPPSASGQLLQINPGAIWEHRAASSLHTLHTTYSGFRSNGSQPQFCEDINSTTTTGGGMIKLAGINDVDFVPAKLNLHGGSHMIIGAGTIFDAVFGEINSLFEASAHPAFTTANSTGVNMFPNDDYLSGAETGFITTFGKMKLDQCIINSFAEGAYYGVFTGTITRAIEIRPGFTGSGFQFEADESTFQNLADGYWWYWFSGVEQQTFKELCLVELLDFNNNSGTGNDLGNASVDACIFSAAQIVAKDPIGSFSITDCSFTDNTTAGWIVFDRSFSNTYDNILVDNCTFEGSTIGICTSMVFTGFSLNHQTSTGNRIAITDNSFDNSASSTGTVDIMLLNTGASVTGNTMMGSGTKQSGIVCIGQGTDPSLSSSFICDNTIHDCRGGAESGVKAGIVTDNWFGYGKLNTVGFCEYGHFSGDNDQGGILFSTYHENKKAGLLLDLDAEVDLSGLHASVSNNYEARNIFRNNNLDNLTTAVGGQIEFLSTVTTAKLIFETDETGMSFNAKDAKNNFFKNSTTDNYFHFWGSTNRAIGSIDSNYWENGNGVSDPPPASPSGGAPFTSITYDDPVSSNTTENSPADVTCGGFTSNSYDREGDLLYSEQEVDTSLDCKSLYALGYNRFKQQQYQESYEIHIVYIEKCAAMEPDAYKAFNDLDASNQFRDETDFSRYSTHLEWLKKVLYYNPDTMYYCEDVASMMRTFIYYGPTDGEYSNGSIAIAKYLLDSAHCGHLRKRLIQQIKEERNEQIKEWEDTVTDPIATPLDTTLPSLDEIGLAILRGPQAGVESRANGNGILSLSAVQNPFNDALELKYTLDQSAMVRIDIHDLLGRAVYAQGQGYKPMGEHRLSLETHDWAAGTYYVRLSTPSGEVQTVKVIKE